MRKMYDAIFCRCGRIHMIPVTEYNWLQEDCSSRRIIHVCQACGRSHMIFLEENCDECSYDLCMTEVKNEVIECSGNTKVYLDTGIKVPMTDKSYANYYHNGHFLSELGGIDGMDVDTERLIREVVDKDKLFSISGYVTDINWKGTEYDHTVPSPFRDEQ